MSFIPKNIFYILVFFAAFFEAIGDVILKKWSVQGKGIILAIGLVVYFLATITWAYSLKYELLSKAIPIVSILNSIIVIFIGIIFFKEDLTTINKVGLILGIVSIVLLQVE